MLVVEQIRKQPSHAGNQHNRIEVALYLRAFVFGQNSQFITNRQ